MVSSDPLDALEAAYRAESRNLFARLVRALGDFDVAEDALADAVRAAAVQWPEQGVPEQPAAWLFQTAKFRGISVLRKKRRLVPLTEIQESSPQVVEADDDLLRLVFTCCHPAISPDAQVALTLREVCELTTEEIASAFLTPAPTIAQRIVRAKAKIRDANIPFELPPRETMPARLPAVLKTIYLVFNEGYASSVGRDLMREDLIVLAILMGRQLYQIFPEAEVAGLLALMLFHHARTRARTTPEGEIVLLEAQDRSLWDHRAIREASALVSSALGSAGHGSYALQAAIAAVYTEAPTYADTDWAEVVDLYELLLTVEPSPVAMLNRAVAVAMRDGAQAGVRLIDALLARGELAEYHRTYAARGELKLQLGDADGAKEDYTRALSLARQEAERRYLQGRLHRIS